MLLSLNPQEREQMNRKGGCILDTHIQNTQITLGIFHASSLQTYSTIMSVFIQK